MGGLQSAGEIRSFFSSPIPPPPLFVSFFLIFSFYFGSDENNNYMAFVSQQSALVPGLCSHCPRFAIQEVQSSRGGVGLKM